MKINVTVTERRLVLRPGMVVESRRYPAHKYLVLRVSGTDVVVFGFTTAEMFTWSMPEPEVKVCPIGYLTDVTVEAL